MKKSELQFFLTLLKERQLIIKRNLNYLNKEIKDLRELDINDDGDYSSISNDGNIDSTIGLYQFEELGEIEKAIDKINKQKKSFGFCEKCGQFIGTERLFVKPHALYCKNCREFVDSS